jgi:hypothetical protein
MFMSYTMIHEDSVFTDEEVTSMLGISVKDIHANFDAILLQNENQIDWLLCTFGELDSTSKKKYLEDTHPDVKQWEAENTPFSFDESLCDLWTKEGVLRLSRFFNTDECLGLYSALIEKYLDMRKYGYVPGMKERGTFFPMDEPYNAVIK